jgi:hypothetical protein
MPLWFMLELVFRIVRYVSDKICPTVYSLHNVIWSSLTIASVVGLGFFLAIRYALRRYDFVPRLSALKQAFETTVYMLTIWFPMELFICGKILFRKKDMNWGKTTHGLVQEEESQRQELLQEKELQKV